MERYYASVEGTAAFILAGGKGTRMGVDKALLQLASKPLIDHAVSLAKSVANCVAIVGDPEKFSAFGTVIADVYPGRGPLAGIHAALTFTKADWNLMLAVDLPFLQPLFLKFMLAEARSSGATVTVPFANGHCQTLCAVYHKKFADAAERALKAGRNKIDALFSDLPLRLVPEEEIMAKGFELGMFRNVNTPADWERAKADLAPPS
jgi:molybdopterin-guanine dinucleotide biosynthesis protein A